MLKLLRPLATASALRPLNVSAFRSIPSIVSSNRFYSTANPELSQKLIDNFKQRSTAKSIHSKKTFLIDYYKYLNDTNEIILYVHHNNMNKAENKKLRSDLNKINAKLVVLRTSLYKVYLRSENETDPADKEISQKNKDVHHPAFPLLDGPTGVICIPSNDPTIVAQALKVLKSAQEKLILVGAKIEKSTFNIDQVDQFKDLPPKDQLQAQLAGLLTVLSGAGLVQTLSSNQNALYLSLKQSVLDRNDGKDVEDL